MRFSSHHVAGSRSGLSVGASSEHRLRRRRVVDEGERVERERRSASGSFVARARRQVGTAAGTCSRHAIRANAGDQASGSSLTPRSRRSRS